MSLMLAAVLFTFTADRPYTPEERAWRELIASRLDAWPAQAEMVGVPYDPAPPPERVSIVLDRRGERDAMTAGTQTIVFDAAALQKAYGDAATNENAERLDRLFRHEFAHLLQKSWLRTHPYDASTPFRAALLAIWREGLGTHHSMSARWRGHSPLARETRQKLEPRFVTRLAALACASHADAEALTADLNEGAFDEKWGSLPVALWLDAEGRDAERRLVLAGPDAIPALAKRHLPPELARVLDETLLVAARCAPR
ncbi:MAG TPA: hypothetical protein VHW00_15570 [Thermoanaerobaculia bacterium]|nr:hypothetical protein [Thermoanaerobaculia bacterium]